MGRNEENTLTESGGAFQVGLRGFAFDAQCRAQIKFLHRRPGLALPVEAQNVVLIVGHDKQITREGRGGGSVAVPVNVSGTPSSAPWVMIVVKPSNAKTKRFI